jgi:hypothetical protein
MISNPLLHPKTPEQYQQFQDMAESVLGYEQQYVYTCSITVNGHSRKTHVLNYTPNQTCEDFIDLLACIEPGVSITEETLNPALDSLEPLKTVVLQGKGIKWFGDESCSIVIGLEPVVGAMIADDTDNLIDAAEDMATLEPEELEDVE